MLVKTNRIRTQVFGNISPKDSYIGMTVKTFDMNLQEFKYTKVIDFQIQEVSQYDLRVIDLSEQMPIILHKDAYILNYNYKWIKVEDINNELAMTQIDYSYLLRNIRAVSEQEEFRLGCHFMKTTELYSFKLENGDNICSDQIIVKI